MFKPDWQGFNAMMDKFNDRNYTRAVIIILVIIAPFGFGILLNAIANIIEVMR